MADDIIKKVLVTVSREFDDFKETKEVELEEGDNTLDGFIAEAAELFPKYEDELAKNKFKLIYNDATVKNAEEFAEYVNDLFDDDDSDDDDEILHFQIILPAKQMEPPKPIPPKPIKSSNTNTSRDLGSNNESKEIEVIEVPAPLNFRVKSKKPTSVTLEWRFDESDRNIANNRKYIKIEIMNKKTNEIITGCDEYCTECIIFSLENNKLWELMCRIKINNNNDVIYSKWSQSCTFKTLPAFDLDDYNTVIDPPTELQVKELHPTYAILLWNHKANRTQKFDYEYTIIQHCNTDNQIKKRQTLNPYFIRMENLKPNTEYKFFATAHYVSRNNDVKALVSDQSNILNIVTPNDNTNNKLQSSKVNNLKYKTTDKKLEINFDSLKTFYGNISYEIIDVTNNNRVMGVCNKIPAFIEGNINIGCHLYETIPGEFNIGVRGVVSNNNRQFRTDISSVTIELDDEKQTLNSEEMTRIEVKVDDAEHEDISMNISLNFTLQDLRTKISDKIIVPDGRNMDIKMYTKNDETITRFVNDNDFRNYINENRNNNIICQIRFVFNTSGNNDINDDDGLLFGNQ